MDHTRKASAARLTRREVLRRTSLLAAGASLTLPGCSELHTPQSRSPLRIGLATDVHYADKPAAGTRDYRESLDKLSSAVARFNEAKTDFVVELGDFIDDAPTAEEELGYLQRIESVFAQACCPRYHVLGNHCVYSLTKEQCLAVFNASRSYYSFDRAGFHFIILDACFRQDGEPYGNRNFKWTDSDIPPAQIEWLTADLRTTSHPTVVFVHQRLDVQNDYGIKSQAQVRQCLETSGKVLAVFQGHYHRNDLKEINGIHYCTLAAMVERDGNAYSLMTLHPNGSIHLEGYDQQSSEELASLRA